MEGILFASFGTTYESARIHNIDVVAAAIEQSFPASVVRQAYTSSMVRHALEKRGVHVQSVEEALRSLAEEGATDIIVSPGHLLPGIEYEKLCRESKGCRKLFNSLTIADPLLANTDDLHYLSKLMAQHYPRRENQAVILMGHGTTQFANVVYAALDYHFKEIGRDDIYVGTVEAYPDLDTLLGLLRGQPYTKVTLAPLMLVAGDHAHNDMAGDDEDSWSHQLQQAGYEVECHVVGLGALPEIRERYIEHIRRAKSSRL